MLKHITESFPCQTPWDCLVVQMGKWTNQHAKRCVYCVCVPFVTFVWGCIQIIDLLWGWIKFTCIWLVKMKVWCENQEIPWYWSNSLPQNVTRDGRMFGFLGESWPSTAPNKSPKPQPTPNKRKPNKKHRPARKRRRCSTRTPKGPGIMKHERRHHAPQCQVDRHQWQAGQAGLKRPTINWNEQIP